MATKAKNKKFNTELEQALFSDRERFEIWLSENWKKTAVVAVAVALVTACAFGIIWQRAHTSRVASYALVDASDADLEKTIAKYPSAPGAAMARMRLASLKSADKKFAEARAVYLQVAADSDAPAELRSQAKLAAAVSWENAGKNTEAVQAYQEILRSGSEAPEVRGEAGLAAARLLLKEKKLKEAASVLQNVTALSSSPRAAASGEMARNRLAALESGEYGPYTR